MLADDSRSYSPNALILTGLVALLTLSDDIQARGNKHHHTGSAKTHHATPSRHGKHHSQPAGIHHLTRPIPQATAADTTEPRPLSPSISSLESDERIIALRGWLKQRSTERGETQPGQYDLDALFGNSGDNADIYGRGDATRNRRLDLSLSPLTSTPPENRSGTEVMRIGRDSDGRVYHRYVFKDSDTEVTPLTGHSHNETDEILPRGRRSNRYAPPPPPASDQEPAGMGESTAHPLRRHQKRKNHADSPPPRAARQPASTRKKPGKHRR